MKTNRKKKLYVAGFDEEDAVVYGKGDGIFSKWVDPLTITQARREVKTLGKCYPGPRRVIYKLVPVETID